MSTSRWMEVDLKNQWSLWLSSAITVTASTLILYRGVSWLKRKFNFSTTNDHADVIVRPSNTVNFDRQAIILPGPERIRTSILSKGEDPSEYLIRLDPGVTTLYENFLKGLRESNDGQCLGYRNSSDEPYEWYTYGQVLEQAHSFAFGLIKLGLNLGPDSFVGIYGRNRPEWIISTLASVSQSSVVVPLYDTLGLDAVHFIVRQADLEIVVCDSFEKAEKLLTSKARLKHIVFMRDIDWSSNQSIRKMASEVNVQLHDFDKVIKLGKSPEAETKLRLPKSDDMYMICYTSGTTGNPKGVMLSHKNVISNASGCIKVFADFGLEPKPGESVISYLPLAHMFEQMVQVIMFYHGGKIGIFQGDINRLVDDMKALKPIFMPAVPRLLNRFYDKVESTLAQSRLKRFLFNWGINSKLSEMKRGIIRKDSFWDKLMFNKIQQQLGGRVRFIATGSAPIRDEILTAMRCMLGCVIVEAYGQTEGTAAATCTLPFDFTCGHVGGPLPSCHVKLVDAPELDYYTKNDEGEVCIRGPCVSEGYFRDPERTKEILDQDGWLHTGDVGKWLPNGTLKIIDRKKHIFKLAQGEYVAPEKIENIYARSPLVTQIFVDGNSLQRHLVAIVVPDEEHTRKLANGKREEDFHSLCSDVEIRSRYLLELNKIGKKLGLNSLELVKSIHLSPDPFTIDNGLLTPTMKLKRPQLRKYFKDVIENLYKESH